MSDVLVEVMTLRGHRTWCGWDKIANAVVMVSHSSQDRGIDGQRKNKNENKDFRFHRFCISVLLTMRIYPSPSVPGGTGSKARKETISTASGALPGRVGWNGKISLPAKKFPKKLPISTPPIHRVQPAREAENI